MIPYEIEIACHIKKALTKPPFRFNTAIETEMLQSGIVGLVFTDSQGQGYRVTVEAIIPREVDDE